MNSKVIVSLAAVSSVLVVAAVSLEGATVSTTHSVNPLNMKIRLDFKKLKVDADQLKSKNFENVQKFVNANGSGMLIAKSVDKSDDLEFRYYHHGEMVNVEKKDILFSDWQAVQEYMDRLNKAEKGTSTKPVVKPQGSIAETEPKNTDEKSGTKKEGKVDFGASQDENSDDISTNNEQKNSAESGDIDNSAGTSVDEDDGDEPKTEDTGTVVIIDDGDKSKSDKNAGVQQSVFGSIDIWNYDGYSTLLGEEKSPEAPQEGSGGDGSVLSSQVEECKMSDELKNVLKNKGVSEEKFEEILHTLFVAIYRLAFTDHYRRSSIPISGFRPENRSSASFLSARREVDMKNAIYAETNWKDWKSVIEKYMGNETTRFNPIVSCYFWVRRDLDDDKELAKVVEELKLSHETVIKHIKCFIDIFYKLAGVDYSVADKNPRWWPGMKLNENGGNHASQNSGNW